MPTMKDALELEALQKAIAAVLYDEASPAEREAVTRWRESSPANEAEYQQLRWLVHEGRTLPFSVRAGRPPTAAELLLQGQSARRPRLRLILGSSGARIVLRAAAVIGALLAGTQLGRHASDGSEQFGAREFVTSLSETATVELRDGSVVRLGPASRLRVAGRGEQREVALVGRAFFVVTPAPDRPFRIQTEAGEITVVGTRFDLEARSEDLRVAVVEGSVRLRAAQQDGETTIKAGAMTRVVNGAVLPVSRISGTDATDWMGRFLAFQSTPLKVAAAEIERLYGVRISILDSALASDVVTAWFADRSLPEVIEVVCLAVVATCTVSDDTVRIQAGQADRPNSRGESVP
jgi:ferric-dicitrate binding protein FerR (iron transport regulator)